MNLAEDAYQMPTGMLLHEAGRQFAMAEVVRDGWQQVLYQRGGWFLLLVHAERTAPSSAGNGGVQHPHPPHRTCQCAECRAYPWKDDAGVQNTDGGQP